MAVDREVAILFDASADSGAVWERYSALVGRMCVYANAHFTLVSYSGGDCGQLLSEAGFVVADDSVSELVMDGAASRLSSGTVLLAPEGAEKGTRLLEECCSRYGKSLSVIHGDAARITVMVTRQQHGNEKNNI